MSLKDRHIGLIGLGLIGGAIKTALEIEGAQVWVFDIEAKDARNFIHMDVCAEDSIQAAITSLKAKKIQLDGIVNCSYPKGPDYGHDLKDVTYQAFTANVGLQLGGHFNIMKNFGFYFKEIGGGSVVSFSSIYGVRAPRFEIYKGQTFTTPIEYVAVKSALSHLNAYMSKYFAGHDVRFNAVAAGGVFDHHGKTFTDSYGQFTTSSRKGMLQPQDLTGAVLFLVSEGSRYMNGQTLVVDDGWTL